MSKEKKAGSSAALEAAAARLADVKLRAPALPEVPEAVQPEAGRKYPVFQELAAMGQEIQDEFSRGQLELADIKVRLEAEFLSLSGGTSAVKPAAADEQAGLITPGAEQAAPTAVKGEIRVTAAAAVPAAGPRPRLLPALVLAGVLCAAAALFFNFYGGPVSVFPLPPTRAAGLCLDPEGRRVFFADPQRQLLFTVSAADGRVASVQSFPAAGLKALAYDGSVFWSSDGKALARHGQAGGYAALGTYTGGGGALLGWDGGKLWAAGADGKLVSYAAGDPPVRDGEYPMPAGRAAGMSVADGKLRLFFPESGKIVVYKIGSRPELLEELDLKRLLPAGEAAGFAMSGGQAWFVTETPPQLLRINPKKAGLLK